MMASATDTGDPMSLRITLIGRGAWGSTLEGIWRAQGHELRSWSRRDGGDPLPLLQRCDLVVMAVAMVAVEPLAQRLASAIPPQLPLLSCSKGITLDRLLTATGLWSSHLSNPLAVLSRPNLAAELAQGLPALDDASLGVYLHALAGERLSAQQGSIAAGDLCGVIGQLLGEYTGV